MPTVPSEPENSASDESASTRALAERALRAIATAQELRVKYAQLEGRVNEAIGWREQLRAQYALLTGDLRDCVVSVAREERALGHSAGELVHLLHEIVENAGLDRSTKRDLATEVVEWGIGGYYAA